MSALASGISLRTRYQEARDREIHKQIGRRGGEICGLCRTVSSGVVYELECISSFLSDVGDRSPGEANAFE